MRFLSRYHVDEGRGVRGVDRTGAREGRGDVGSRRLRKGALTRAQCERARVPFSYLLRTVYCLADAAFDECRVLVCAPVCQWNSEVAVNAVSNDFEMARVRDAMERIDVTLCCKCGKKGGRDTQETDADLTTAPFRSLDLSHSATRCAFEILPHVIA